MNIIKKFNTKLNFFLKILKIKSNNYIKNIQIIVEGNLNKFNKNIIILNPLTSNHHSLGFYKKNINNFGWWYKIRNLFKKFNLININNFCNSSGSTNFSNKNPFKNKNYNFNLPNINLEDLIKIQKISINKFYIINIFILIGGSFGGIQILIWNLLFPFKVKFCICISSTNYINNKNYILNNLNKLIINYYNYYLKNNYYLYKYNYIKNLKLSRNLSHIFYLSFYDLKNKKFKKFYKNYLLNLNKKKIFKYFNYKCNKFILNFDLNYYLFLINLINKFYLNKKKIYLKIKKKKLIYLINFKNDFRFNKKSSINILKFFIKNKIKIFYKNFKFFTGHDSFLIKNFFYFYNINLFNIYIGEIGFEPTLF